MSSNLALNNNIYKFIDDILANNSFTKPWDVPYYQLYVLEYILKQLDATRYDQIKKEHEYILSLLVNYPNYYETLKEDIDYIDCFQQVLIKYPLSPNERKTLMSMKENKYILVKSKINVFES